MNLPTYLQTAQLRFVSASVPNCGSQRDLQAQELTHAQIPQTH